MGVLALGHVMPDRKIAPRSSHLSDLPLGRVGKSRTILVRPNPTFHGGTASGACNAKPEISGLAGQGRRLTIEWTTGL